TEIAAERSFLGRKRKTGAVEFRIFRAEAFLEGGEIGGTLPTVEDEKEIGIFRILPKLGAVIARGTAEERRPVAVGPIGSDEVAAPSRRRTKLPKNHEHHQIPRWIRAATSPRAC